MIGPGNGMDETSTPPAAADPIEEPGEFPYTRGIYRTMYRGKLWTMRQYAGYGTAAETNRRLRFLMGQGQTGLSLAFDLPTQLGLDADDPLAEGEAGKVGVSVSSLADMEEVLAGIPLGEVSLSMTINATAPILLAMVIAAAEKTGLPPARLSGTVQNDILKEYVARGTYVFPPEPSLRLAVDVIAYCSENLPRWNPISVGGYHLREAGATAAQEIAFALAHALAYVEAAVRRGLDVDAFAPRLTFFFAAGLRLFEEAAKLRAARRMWARLMKRRFGAAAPKSLQLRVHAQTSGSALTAQQPQNNVARVTLQALGAVLGGTQSLHTNALDEALSLPSEETARLALRTQQVIAYETGVADEPDPLAGSYYVEQLTDRLEREATALLDEIERQGGAVAALRSGWMQRQIHAAAYRTQLDIEAERRIVVGVNRFAAGQARSHTGRPAKRPAEPSSAASYAERLQQLRERRNHDKTAARLEELRRAAATDENLLPYIINCVKEYSTVGEICESLKSEFGQHEEMVTPWINL